MHVSSVIIGLAALLPFAFAANDQGNHTDIVYDKTANNTLIFNCENADYNGKSKDDYKAWHKAHCTFLGYQACPESFAEYSEKYAPKEGATYLEYMQACENWEKTGKYP